MSLFGPSRKILPAIEAICELALREWPPQLPALDGTTASQLLIKLNCISGDLVDTYGADNAGQIIWGLYGAGGIVHSALHQSSKRDAVTSLRSIRTLYRNAFTQHCAQKIGERYPTKLDLACIMLWDMDGGLFTAAFKTTYEMESIATEILKSCLSSSNEFIQESALHALNHLYYDNPRLSAKLIHEYLSQPGLSPSAIQNARLCLRGMAQ